MKLAIQSVRCALAVAALGVGTAGAQVAPAYYHYSAKVICGVQEKEKSLILTRGAYGSVINILNPNRETVQFSKTLVLTVPPGNQQLGRRLELGGHALASEQAIATECDELRARFPAVFGGGFIEGYVVIRSARPLDVMGVYTSASLDKDGVPVQSGIDIEHARERVIQ